MYAQASFGVACHRTRAPTSLVSRDSTPQLELCLQHTSAGTLTRREEVDGVSGITLYWPDTAS